ncbi:MAG: hypothetical protein MK008_11915 [Bdellovibrionales bacterium]|nr:hypothetical protein [Bdellovibrionales bacterium]
MFSTYVHANNMCSNIFKDRKWTKTEEVSTTAQGEEFTFKALINGREEVFTGKFAPEMERRLNLKKSTFTIEGRKIKTPEDLIVDILDKFARPYRYIPDGPLIWPRALRSHEERWHDDRKSASKIIEINKSTPKKSLFTTTLQGMQYNWKERQGVNTPEGNWRDKKPIERIEKFNDSYKIEYIVRKQIEKGIYYDTVGGTLAEQGIALRVKKWYSPHKVINENTLPEAQMLFVKLSDVNAKGLFHSRTEFQVSIPNSFGHKEVASIGESLISYIGRRPMQLDAIVPSKYVENERYGFNLMLGRSQKKNGVKQIGFLTVDTFTVTDLLSSGHRTKPLHQIEIELFPKFQKFATSHKEEFESFFSSIESRYDAELSFVPKYLQAN